MGFTSEIYLTNKFVSREEWLELIKIISHYNGFLKEWKIIVINDKNLIRYFVKTKCALPATINNLKSFLLKPTTTVEVPKYDSISFSWPKIDSSIVDLINHSEIKNRGTLRCVEIRFLKLSEDRIKSKMSFYLDKDGIIKKNEVLLVDPASVLSIDFEGNKRYFYKGSPTYLEINKILHLLNHDSNNSLMSVDTFPYLKGKLYLNQNNFSFDKHSIVIGSSGCGKSKFISLLISNIERIESLRQKYKVVVIDPHADIENDIGGIGKVIDFKSGTDSIDLFGGDSDDVVASTELLLDLLNSLIADQYNSKLERVLRHSIHLLLADGAFNFRNLRRLILDLEYRSNLIKKLKGKLPVSVVDFFLSDFNELKTKYYGEAISPIIGFIDEMEMIPVFNSDGNYENLKNTIKNNFLTSFSLDRTKLGDKVTKTIAGLIMQQLLAIVQNREIDEHIIFVIDEVAVVENPILSRYLSEARKYNLSLILAGQYFNQISEELKNSIFANVVNYFIFRVSKLDATVLVDNFNMKIHPEDSKEKRIKLLTELNDRECVVRMDSNGVLLPAFKGVTSDYMSRPRIKNEVINVRTDDSNDHPKKRLAFRADANVSLKDILISNSTNKEV